MAWCAEYVGSLNLRGLHHTIGRVESVKGLMPNGLCCKQSAAAP